MAEKWGIFFSTENLIFGHFFQTAFSSRQNMQVAWNQLQMPTNILNFPNKEITSRYLQPIQIFWIFGLLTLLKFLAISKDPGPGQ